MDSLTHIALGACMGEAFAGRTVGKKAMLWGILAQSLPDIDFIASFWLRMPDDLLAHRGFTHSIVFCLLVTPVIALSAYRAHKPHDITYYKWIFFVGSAILGHIFLDAFNNYGVGWFEPFSHYRVSFNSIYVADPFFSVPPAMAVFFLVLFKRGNRSRALLWKAGLGMSFLYLGYGAANKMYVMEKTRQALALEHIGYTRLLVTPAPLQSWLFFVVAGNDSGFYTGYRSVFDKNIGMDLHYHLRNNFLRSQVENKNDLEKLIRFSQGYYTLEQHSDSLVFNDLRFGQVTGWQDPGEIFAFHYYLQPESDNTLVVQRGRFAKWNRASFHSLVQRIRGN